MGVGPVEDLDEVLLDEEDPTRVIKVGKELKVEIKARFGIFEEEPGCLCLVT